MITLQKFVRSWVYPVTELLYPRICPVCAKSLMGFEKIICTPCRLRLPLTDYATLPDNKVAAVFWGRTRFVHASSYLHYRKGNSVQKLIHQLKYKGRQDIGEYLGSLYGNVLKDVQALHDACGIVPVPLHRRKENMRGYNQSFAIAAGLSAKLQIPVMNDVAVRNVFNTSQTKKDRFGRWENARERFSVKHCEGINDMHLLLTDDVITTGSTLEALAMAFDQFPGVRLSVACLGSAY